MYINYREVTIVDPTEIEEKVSEGELVIGMNNYRELCGLHFSGRAIGNKGLILKCSSRAAIVASDWVKRLKSTIEEDSKMREKNRGASDGLVDGIHLDRLLSASRDRQALRLQPETVQAVIDRAKSKMDIDYTGNNTFYLVILCMCVCVRYLLYVKRSKYPRATRNI